MPVSQLAQKASRKQWLGQPGVGLPLVLVVFAAATAFINPIRNMPLGDDWAYALTVRHLIETGKYQLHDWAAANMPLQIYLAAAASEVAGYSFAVLRLCTIALCVAGLVALYALLRDFRVREREACLLTLVVFTSPLVVFLSFTFHTDVQFLAWMMLSLLLYTRALRRLSYWPMVLGSVAASAAIGTRQFGVALILGLLATWLVAQENRWRNAKIYIIGLLSPVITMSWQLSAGVGEPTFTQAVRLGEQLAYVRDLTHFLPQVLLWRPSVIIQYTGLFLVPLAPLLLFYSWAREKQVSDGTLPPAGTAIMERGGLPIVAAYTLGGILYGYYVVWRGLLMPSLAWVLPHNLLSTSLGFRVHLAVTAASWCLGSVLTWIILSSRILSQPKVINRPYVMVASTGSAIFGLQLLYVQFQDIYLIQFLPFAVIMIGAAAPAWRTWCTLATAVLVLCMLVASSLWTRSRLELAEAMWTAAETASDFVTMPEDVGGNMTWSSYHGAFDAWVRSAGGHRNARAYIGAHQMHFSFFATLDNQYKNAKYLLVADTSSPVSGSGAQQPASARVLVRRVDYEDLWLRKRSVRIMRLAN